MSNVKFEEEKTGKYTG